MLLLLGHSEGAAALAGLVETLGRAGRLWLMVRRLREDLCGRVVLATEAAWQG